MNNRPRQIAALLPLLIVAARRTLGPRHQNDRLAMQIIDEFLEEQVDAVGLIPVNPSRGTHIRVDERLSHGLTRRLGAVRVRSEVQRLSILARNRGEPGGGLALESALTRSGARGAEGTSRIAYRDSAKWHASQ